MNNPSATDRSFKAISLSILLLVLGLGMTIALFTYQKKAEAFEKSEKLTSVFHQVSSQLQQEIDRNLNALYALKASIVVHDGLSKRAFEGYGSFFNAQIKSIQALEWVPKVKASSVDSFTQSIKEDYPNFTIFQRPGEEVLHPSNGFFYPVVHVVPFTGNEVVVGYDPGEENRSRLETIKRAERTGKAAISKEMSLLQTGKNQPGVLAFVPIYKNEIDPSQPTEIHSFIEGVYLIDTLLHQSLSSIDQLKHVDLHIFRRDKDMVKTLYGNPITKTHSEAKIGTVEIADTQWEFEVALKPTPFSINSAYATFLLGTLITLLLAGFVFSYLTDNRKELRKYNQQLENKNKELEQYAYVASHDLQEPLRSMMGLVELLKDHAGDTLDHEAQLYLTNIKASAQRMSNLINTLLEYSRIGRMENPQMVALDQVMKEVKEDLSELIKATQTELVMRGTLPIVYGYPTALKQLFQNLISNSIKFRKKEEAPKITFHTESTSKGWNISVTDNGIGIPPNQLEKIFVIFKRLHNQTDYPGTGIGLTFCKKIVELHNGEIKADSQLGKGTTFTFSLNLNKK